MQATRLDAIHEPLRIQDVPTPEPGPGEVRVRLHAAALNHRDVWVQQGKYPGMKLPVTPGSDGAGVVEKVGDGVDMSWLGREVILNPGHDWGDNPRFYQKSFTILGMPADGTFAEYLTIRAEYLHDKPAHLSFAEAAALPLGGLTAWRALFTRARLQAGERLLVSGVGGGVALLGLQFAVAAGAEVWVTSGSEEKIERAVALGARGGISYRQERWERNLVAQAGGGFDVVLDSAGGEGFAQLVDAAAPGGRIVFYGGTRGNLTNIPPARVFFKQLDLLGTTMGTPDEFAAMLHFVNEHQLRPVLDQTFPLAEAEAALRRMDAGEQFGKIILEVGKSHKS
jgi:NADPH:quinone reductase-like Zn-dependent oxidoreductase